MRFRWIAAAGYSVCLALACGGPAVAQVTGSATGQAPAQAEETPGSADPRAAWPSSGQADWKAQRRLQQKQAKEHQKAVAQLEKARQVRAKAEQGQSGAERKALAERAKQEAALRAEHFKPDPRHDNKQFAEQSQSRSSRQQHKLEQHEQKRHHDEALKQQRAIQRALAQQKSEPQQKSDSQQSAQPSKDQAKAAAGNP
jgi:hypothetical protein